MDFSNVKVPESKPFTEPGTIDVFLIKKVEFMNSKEKGSRGMKVTFENKDSSFAHTFWLTEKALERVQYLVSKILGRELKDTNVTEQQLTAILQGKSLPLKVIGGVSNNGKGYPDLSFSGFSGDSVETLKFTSTELGLIDKAKEAMRNSAVSQADKESTASAPAGQADNEAY